jgi:hypothetical protein
VQETNCGRIEAGDQYNENVTRAIEVMIKIIERSQLEPDKESGGKCMVM